MSQQCNGFFHLFFIRVEKIKGRSQFPKEIQQFQLKFFPWTMYIYTLIRIHWIHIYRAYILSDTNK